MSYCIFPESLTEIRLNFSITWTKFHHYNNSDPEQGLLSKKEMDEHDALDFNDAMFQFNEEPRPEVQSVSNDSNLPSSISGYGEDANNHLANEEYIQENQQLQAIINGAGIQNEHIDEGNYLMVDSGLGSSMSRTRSSEFIPEVIEIRTIHSTTTRSGDQPDVDDNKENNESDRSNFQHQRSDHEDEVLKENDDKSIDAEIQDCKSAFDVALDRGYREQAKYYYDHAIGNGLGIKTKHVKSLREVCGSECECNDFVKSNEVEEALQHDEPLLTGNFSKQLSKMLELDFQMYLTHIQNNEFKKVLDRLNKKDVLNEPEKQIKNNIKTKKKRSALKHETIELIKKNLNRYRDFFEKIDEIEKDVQSSKEKGASSSNFKEETQ